MDSLTENGEQMIFSPSHWELHPTPEGQLYPYLLLHACGIGEDCYECTISIPQEVYQSMIDRGVKITLPGMIESTVTHEGDEPSL